MMLHVEIMKDDPRTHHWQKCPLIAVVVLCTQGRLVGLSCCAVICADQNWACGMPAWPGNISIILLLFLCNWGWRCYGWPFLNFFSIRWNLRGIGNTGLVKISWALGPVFCSSTLSKPQQLIWSRRQEVDAWLALGSRVLGSHRVSPCCTSGH